jgi:hypothetical protein
MKFPKPWTLQQTGHDEFVVLDAEGRKLFYIVGDEGDDDISPSALFHGEDSALLIDEIVSRLELK